MNEKSEPTGPADADTTPAYGPAPDARLFVAGVEKGLRILECFDERTPALTIGDIDARCGLGRSATQRYVYTLQWLGYLRRDDATRCFSPTLRVFNLMRSLSGMRSLIERDAPRLAELARTTRETVSWIELDGDEIVVLANYPSTHITHVNLPVGSRFPALSSSSGRVLLCNLPPAELLEKIRAMPPHERSVFGARSDPDILALIQRPAKDGYAITTNKVQNSISISAPVRDVSGRTTAVINLSTLRTRYDRAGAQRILLPQVLALAAEVSVPRAPR
ncbi:IclR family transcriptional regulator [Verticiella sediminum]|nr:helix-turn-helix domain-containing protein [Verticiella sediminum]